MRTSDYQKFEIAESVRIATGGTGIADGHPQFVTLRNLSTSCEADIYLYGATVTAWRRNGSQDLLFLSSRSDLTGNKPIRGGIPIIFPQFGNGPLPAHGFARNNPWNISVTGINSHEAPFVTLELVSSPTTMAIWPHEFIAEYTVTLSETLNCSFKITNTGSSSLSFQFALHTYFAVSNISAVSVHGLIGADYIDKVKENARFRDTDESLSINSETDRVYLSTPNTIGFEDRGDSGVKKTVSIIKSNLSDAVVWNPWETKCASMKDLAPEDYQKFVCVEAGQIDDWITLKPQASWTASQTLEAN